MTVAAMQIYEGISAALQAGGDAVPVLELAEHTLNQIAL